LGKPSAYHTPQLQFYDVIVGPVIYVGYGSLGAAAADCLNQQS